MHRTVTTQYKRKIKVFITDKGKAFAREKQKEIEAYFGHLLECLGEEDTKEYLRLSLKINQIIKDLK